MALEQRINEGGEDPRFLLLVTSPTSEILRRARNGAAAAFGWNSVIQ
jgi:hypothetical protein